MHRAIYLMLTTFLVWMMFQGIFPELAGTAQRAARKLLRRIDAWSERP